MGAQLYTFPPRATSCSQISPNLPLSGISKGPRFPPHVKASAPTSLSPGTCW